MKLPFLPTKEAREYLYAVAISNGITVASLWHVENGDVIVDQISEPVAWDIEQEESLIEAVDTAIAGFSKQGSQVLFALPDDWVSGQGIAQARKPLLKSLTQKLELHSVGFVVTLEAIIAFLREKGSAPLHAVCIFVEDQAFVVAVVRHGQSSNLVRVGRSGQSVQDLLEAWSRLKATDLPNLLLLSSISESQGNLTSLAEELTTQTWDEQLFLQIPKVEQIPLEHVLQAVAVTGGREVAKALGLFIPKSSKPTPVAPQFEPLAPAVAVDQPEENEILEQKPSLRDRLPRPNFSKKKMMGLLGVLGILLIAGLVGSLFVLPSLAQVSLAVTVKNYPVSADTTLVLDSEIDEPKENALPATLTSVEVSGSKEVPTTGKKNTGDKATGTVTLYNKTSQSKAFPKGTQLKTGKLTFVTDEDTTIASASSTISETVHGKATVKAIAGAVGEESNIDKNVEMTIGTFDKSAFVARSESPFTGGSSRTVQAVAQKDQDDAVAAVLGDLRAKATETVKTKANAVQDAVVFDDLLIINRKFDQTVGAEASSVSVNVTASASGLLYTKAQMLVLAKEAVSQQIPAGVSLIDDKTSTQIRGQKQLKSMRSMEVTAHIESEGKPTVDPEQYAKILAGKPLEDARTFLDSQSAISTYTLRINPPLFAALIKTLPKDPTKIHVVTE